MAPTQYTRVTLAERPKANIDSNTFHTEVVPFDLKPKAKEALVKVLYLSIDPTQRTWINDVRGYMEPVKIGEIMRSGGIGVVTEAGEDSAFAVGDFVYGSVGWQEYGVFADHLLVKLQVPPGAELLDFLGPLGMTGLTAYFGLIDVGQVKAGETLVVSGAAGATGSIACQIGKKIGAKVVAIAGSAEKCEWLEKDLGVDKALNYKSPTFRKEFKEAVGFLDVYFDNVGGEILDLCLSRLNKGARIALCGAIADYNTSNSERVGMKNYTSLISQTAKIQGFLIFDYKNRFAEARQELGKWLIEGSLKRKFYVLEGINKCPEALPLLFSGVNQGKFVIKVADHTPRAGL